MTKTPGTLQSVWYEVDGQRVHVRVAGADGAPVVVLVHGWLVSSRYMIRLARALAPRWKIYAIDLPGTGRSHCRTVRTTQELGAFLIQWMDLCSLTNVTLVANSYGCQISVEAGLIDQTRFKSMLFTGPTIDPDARSPFRLAGRLFREFFRENPIFWLIAFRDLFDSGVVRALRSLKHLINHQMLERAALLPIAVQVVRGEHDRVCPQNFAEELAQRLGDKDVIKIPNAAHTINFGHPDEIGILLES